MSERLTMSVVVLGNPFDGLNIVGPFDGPDEAHDWADDHADHSEWWIVNLTHPDNA